MSQKADKKSSKFVYILASFKLKNFFGDKRKKLSIQNLLRDPVFWLKIQLLFLSSYFFLGTGHLIAASSPPDQEFIVAVVFVVMDHNIIKHWPSPRGSMFWCSIFNANNLLLLLQIAFSPFFPNLAKSMKEKLFKETAYILYDFFTKPIFQARVWLGKKLHQSYGFFQDCHFIFRLLSSF